MLIETLREFQVLSEYLNITKASQALHMSQSTLSRHVSSLESELGYTLFTRNNNKLALTPAGQLFADQIHPLLNELTSIVEECRRMSTNSLHILTALEPPYQDKAAEDYYTTLHQAASLDETLRFNYTVFYRKNMMSALKSGELDISMFYRAEAQENVLKEFELKGLHAIRIGSERFRAYFNRRLPLSDMDEISISELADYQILAANDLYRPLDVAIRGLFSARQLTPRFKLINTRNQTEFLQYHDDRAVFIMPDGMQNDPRMRTRMNMESRLIGDSDCLIDCYIVSPEESYAAGALNAIAEL